MCFHCHSSYYASKKTTHFFSVLELSLRLGVVPHNIHITDTGNKEVKVPFLLLLTFLSPLLLAVCL